MTSLLKIAAWPGFYGPLPAFAPREIPLRLISPLAIATNLADNSTVGYRCRCDLKTPRIADIAPPSEKIPLPEGRHEDHHHLLLAMKLSAPGFQSGSRAEETIRRRS
jgi:hypothetical protein